MVSSFLGDFSHYIASYGYLAIALGILLENVGLPMPGETLLVLGGVAASHGRLDIRLVLLYSWLAAVAGNQIGYYIGRTGGHRLLVRYGSRIGITSQRLDWAEEFFDRRGEILIIFARFFIGLRQFSGIVAGMLEMGWARFLVFNAVGAALWIGFWGMLAFWLGKRVQEFIENIWPLIIGVVLLAIAAAAAHHVWRRWRKRQVADAPQPRCDP